MWGKFPGALPSRLSEFTAFTVFPMNKCMDCVFPWHLDGHVEEALLLQAVQGDVVHRQPLAPCFLGSGSPLITRAAPATECLPESQHFLVAKILVLCSSEEETEI